MKCLNLMGAIAAIAWMPGCGESGLKAADAGGDGADAGPVAPQIGTGDHSATSVTLTVLADSSNDLARPTDLAFNPLIPDDLWVVNYDDDSVVILHEATSSNDPMHEHKKDFYNNQPAGQPASHFMPEPTSIAFGADFTSETPEPSGAGGVLGTFATCGDSRNDYDGFALPNDFMGAVLWPSDLEMFANRPFTPLGSHLDMLHASPLCMGLAHQEDNVYWAFTGRARDGGSFTSDGAIVKYDFDEDHGPGNDDHFDGEALQYVTGEVDRQARVPSHLVFDPETELLYIADTGNGRIATLDTTTGEVGEELDPHLEPFQTYNVIDDAVISDVVPAGGDLDEPSGIELYNGLLYVTDNATGVIHAFDLVGNRVNWLDTGRGEGALAGIAFGPDGKLYFVDMDADEVVRIDP